MSFSIRKDRTPQRKEKTLFKDIFSNEILWAQYNIL